MKNLLKHSLLYALLLSLFALAGTPQAFAAATPQATAPQEVLPLTVFQNLQAGKKQTVIVYGTSLTAGGAWAGSLKEYFDKHFPGQVTFLNSARNGMTSDWGVKNLQTRVLDHKPDLVFIEFSANDAATKHNISQEKAAANLDSMVKALHAQNPQVDIVLQTMNPAWDSPKSAPKQYGSERPQLAEYYDGYRRYAREHNLPLVDNYPTWFKMQQEEPEKFQKAVSDGIHPHSGPSREVTWPAIEALVEKARTLAANSPTTTPAPAASTSPTVALPTVKENFHIYILMGQSNMVGRDTRTLDFYKENPRVLALNENGEWILAKDPLHAQMGRIAVGVGPGTSFASEMLKTSDLKITIGLVPCAVGGTPLRRWVKGGDLYEQAVGRAKIASQRGVIKGVLWHQGESDTDKQGNADSYEARLTKMLGDLRSDLGLLNLPIVVGQLGEFMTTEKYPYVEIVRAAIRRIPVVVPHTGFADSAGLGHQGDGLHFSAAAEREMGARFAKAMQELQKQTQK